MRAWPFVGRNEELTRREREVVRLAAAGQSSQQIAQMLRLSPRTVDNHLGRAYAKLGVSGRHTLGPLLGQLDPGSPPDDADRD